MVDPYEGFISDDGFLVRDNFDRWLAAHDKAVRDAALTEAAEAAEQEPLDF